MSIGALSEGRSLVPARIPRCTLPGPPTVGRSAARRPGSKIGQCLAGGPYRGFDAGAADGPPVALPGERRRGVANRAGERAGGVSVYRRPNGKWAVQIYDPAAGRSRHVGTFATRREARRAESEATDQRTATGREMVGSFAARWARDYPRPRASTNVHNAERVKPFGEAHDRRRMDSTTVEEARVWALRHPSQANGVAGGVQRCASQWDRREQPVP